LKKVSKLCLGRWGLLGIPGERKYWGENRSIYWGNDLGGVGDFFIWVWALFSFEYYYGLVDKFKKEK
jgi:hypothetical protein